MALPEFTSNRFNGPIQYRVYTQCITIFSVLIEPSYRILRLWKRENSPENCFQLENLLGFFHSG